MAAVQQAARSDKILSEKWDAALSNGIVKTGLGFGAGVVASVLFFRRRAFPVWLGTGVGAGRAWAEGDALFRDTAILSQESGVRQVSA